MFWITGQTQHTTITSQPVKLVSGFLVRAAGQNILSDLSMVLLVNMLHVSTVRKTEIEHGKCYPISTLANLMGRGDCQCLPKQAAKGNLPGEYMLLFYF